MGQRSQRTPELLRRFVDAEVDFVVIGGVAAIAWGSTQFTRDLDLAVRFSVDNFQRILRALEGLHPRLYQTLGKPALTRTAEDLATWRNVYLETDLGIVDCLGEVPPVPRYDDLVEASKPVVLFERTCRVISIAQLIAVKEHVRRPKDLLVARELRAIAAAVPPR